MFRLLFGGTDLESFMAWAAQRGPQKHVSSFTSATKYDGESAVELQTNLLLHPPVSSMCVRGAEPARQTIEGWLRARLCAGFERIQ